MSCQYCSRLDFHSILAQCRKIRWDEIVYDYRPLEHREGPTTLKAARMLEFEWKWQENCEMCDFLPMTTKGMNLRYPLPCALYAFEGRNFFQVLREEGDYEELDWGGVREVGKKKEEIAQRDFFVFLVRDEYSDAKPEISKRKRLGLSFTVLDRDEDMGLHRGLKPEVDMELVKRWLDTCHSKHEKCREMVGHSCANGLPYGLQVIDCRNNTVIPAPQDCEYVALSYVWGRREVFSFDNRPKTIGDAMEMTLQLGKRYLWVDKYCINQFPHTDEEKRHKSRQLNAMGETYGAAVATIVAVEGVIEDHGLCGIGSPRKADLSFLTSDGLQFIKRFHEEVDYIRDTQMLDSSQSQLWIPLSGRARTYWAARGWTFQEALLSLRLLFMFDTGVFFQCHTMACQEADRIVEKRAEHWCEPPGFFAQLGANPGWRPGVYTDSPEDVVLERFWACVQDYSFCKLTYDGDALIAFTGILQRFASPPPKSGLVPLPNLMGIPLLPSSFVSRSATGTSPLLLGLAWEFSTSSRHRPVLRRPGKDDQVLFPSWTWAGWKGPIVAPLIEEDLEDVTLFPFASVVVPPNDPTTFLRITAPVIVAPTKRFWDGYDAMQEEQSKCDNFDGYTTPQELAVRNTTDAEVCRQLNQQAWDIAIIFSYTFTRLTVDGDHPKYCQAFVLILKWLDKEKTKAERVGGRNLRRSELPSKEDLMGEMRSFELY